MKKLPSVKAIMAVIAIILINILSANEIDGNKKINNSETLTMNNYVLASSISNERLLNQTKVNNELLALNEDTEEVKEPVIIPEIVYDGMTMEELATKLEKNLKSTLKGYGTVFAEYSIKYEVDPYLSLAIVLHETGCYSGKCSTLASKCNNIGGMKGSPGCGGGAYKKFSSLEDGIEAFYKNLSKNYYKKGLTTPETIGKKYAESESWPTRIRYYMNIIEKS
jgi:hypothetical protein